MSRQPIQNWLTQAKPLKTLVNKAHYLAELTAIVRRYLAEDLAEHCQVANYTAGKLKVLVDSSVWASRLRFCLPHLSKTLQSVPAFGELRQIDYSVQPLYKTLARTPKSKPIISTASAELITSTAQSISDTKLQQALLRLAAKQGETKL